MCLTKLIFFFLDLEESRDELQAAAAALQARRELLMPGGQDANDNTINRRNSPSLATELLLTTSVHDQVYFILFFAESYSVHIKN